MALVKPWFPNATHRPRQETMHEKGQTFSRVEHSAPSQCSVSCHRLLQQQTFQPGGATNSVLGAIRYWNLELPSLYTIYSEAAFKHLKRPCATQGSSRSKMQPTRGPRTRMLTRMLMVQMSKHMDMQSRRTLFCNSLLGLSRTYFPCNQSAVWSGKCRVWSVEWKV